MKKIFIMAHSLDIGGAERALLGLLENINISEYQVDLFLLRHQGELLSYIPKGIVLLPEIPEYACLGIPLVDVLKKRHFRLAYYRWKGRKYASRRLVELDIIGDNNIYNEYSHKYTVNVLPQINHKKYDLAISFMSPHYIVASKVYARQKVAWIHTDYDTLKVDVQSEIKMWDRYDKIIAISDSAANSFLKTFPTLIKKMQVIKNMLPIQYMNNMSEEVLSEDNEILFEKKTKLLSIGRFCTAKNFDNIPNICRIICDKGYDIKWYLIGYGGDEALIRKKIEEEGMQDNVIILGKKENPYPFIKACNLYVQPSRYEGKCVAVIEAQMLHKPVLITKFATSESQLLNGIDGVIVPIDNEQCANGIIKVLKDIDLQKRIVEGTFKKDYSESIEIEKIYALMEGKEYD